METAIRRKAKEKKRREGNIKAPRVVLSRIKEKKRRREKKNVGAFDLLTTYHSACESCHPGAPTLHFNKSEGWGQ